MSGLFKSKAVEPEYKTTPQDTRINQLWDLLYPQAEKRASQLGTEYSGELIAPLTDMEKQALSQFQTYLDTGLGTQSNEYKMAQKEMENIFGDYYDPWKKGGPIEYTTRQLKKTLTEDLLPSARHAAAGKGNYWTQSLKDTEEDIITDTMDELAKYSYGEEDALRNLRASMIPQAVSMSAEPVNRLMNAMRMAGYERTQYQQPLDTAKYNEFVRLAQELNIPLEALSGLAGQSGGVLAYPSYAPSAFEQYIMPLLQSGAKVATAMALP